MILNTYKRRAVLTLGVVGLAGLLGACDSLLEVSNPGAIGDGTVDDPTMKTELVNSVVGEFQRMYTSMAYWGAILSDEAVTGHNYWQIEHFDRRMMDHKNSQLTEVYNPVQRARALGEDLSAKLKGHLGADAGKDVGYATALTYTGYSNIFLGEYFCYAPVEPTSAAIDADEILERSLPYFEEAIQVATAAKAAATKKADSTAADLVLNIARVGGARAALNVGNSAKAIEFAKEVPADFVAWVEHTDNKSWLENNFFSAVSGTNHNIGVDVAFRGLNDTRIRYNATGRKGHNQLTVLYTPYQSSAYSGWTAAGANAAFLKDTGHRLASGLEARYILAEAGGMTEGEVLAFVNERRAVGGQAATAVAGDALKAELRDQRRRDFFMDGHRLGDLRRYLKQGIDEFPQGQHPNVEWGEYEDATCYVPHYSEQVGNPGYRP